MRLPAQRRCDVCQQEIEAGTSFVRVRYELFEDSKPEIGSSEGGSIHASNEVEAHETCCAPEFFLLSDLRRRRESGDRAQRNRWSHENAPIDPIFAARVMGCEFSPTRFRALTDEDQMSAALLDAASRKGRS